MITICFEKKDHRAVAYEEGKVIGICIYEEVDNCWNITHTEVLPGYKGTGLAKNIVMHVAAQAKKANVHLIAACPYAKHVIEQ